MTTETTAQAHCHHCGDVNPTVEVLEDGRWFPLCVDDTGCATDPYYASLPQRSI